MMHFIFDLDHTIVDSSHRQATRPDGSLDLDHWREHSTAKLIERDTLLPLAHEWRKIQRRQGAKIIVCTARVMGPDAMRLMLSRQQLHPPATWLTCMAHHRRLHPP